MEDLRQLKKKKMDEFGKRMLPRLVDMFLEDVPADYKPKDPQTAKAAKILLRVLQAAGVKVQGEENWNNFRKGMSYVQLAMDQHPETRDKVLQVLRDELKEEAPESG